MSLLKEIREKINKSRKEGDKFSLSILTTIEGEIQRKRELASDKDAESCIRKIYENNKKSIIDFASKDLSESQLKWMENLKAETQFLEDLLPKTLSEIEIENMITNSNEELDKIKNARSNGEAIGIAMKFLKSKGCNVLGNDVSKVVNQIKS